MNICIILPAYNEEKSISSSILSFHKHIPEAAILVVNNNSTDNTEYLAQKTLSKLIFKNKYANKNSMVITERRQGKANAIKKAFKIVNADFYVICDADMTYQASEVWNILNPVIEQEADIVVGDRLSGGQYNEVNRRKFHLAGNNLVKLLINKLFNSNLNDIMSGYRALSIDFVSSYPILVDGFEIETDMTIFALDRKFKIKEVDISYADRPKGSHSKLNTFSDGLKVLSQIIRIFRHYRPILFFGFFSLLFFIFGLFAGYPVLNEWISSGIILHIPLAILATGLELIAALLFAIALILDSIAFHNKMIFELNLNMKKN